MCCHGMEREQASQVHVKYYTPIWTTAYFNGDPDKFPSIRAFD